MASDAAAGSPGSSRSAWTRARESSQQIVFQSAIEEIEAEAMKDRQELDELKAQNESQGQSLRTAQDEIRRLKEELSTKESQLEVANKEAKTKVDKWKAMEDETSIQGERMERLQAEADNLREEIRYDYYTSSDCTTTPGLSVVMEMQNPGLEKRTICLMFVHFRAHIFSLSTQSFLL
jgi:chromosome segregation ATPase